MWGNITGDITDQTDLIALIGTGGGTVSPLTTKGDLYGFDTDNARVPVGLNGQVLMADSSVPLGVKWTSPSSGTSAFDGGSASTSFAGSAGLDLGGAI